MMMQRRWCGAMAILMCLSACGSPQPTRDGAAPADLTLSLAMTGEGRRYTWFELRPDRTLGFSGGIDARQHATKHDIDLTEAQVDAVWQVILDEGLLEARDAEGDTPKTSWQLTIRRGRSRSRVSSTDDAVPGIPRLHDLLFSYQAAKRYNLPGIGGGK